jgi:glycosyltransferase involved in cell wall biosynthesis
MGPLSDAEQKKPLISVIIPAYNAAKSIARTLDSVLSQSLTDFEIIVVNDGSPDTGAFELALSNYRDRITYIKEENHGAAAARNTGIKAARGEFLAFLDADDFWLPNYLEAQMGVLRQTGADVVYCDALIVGSSPLKGRTFIELAPSRCEVTPESLLSVDVGLLTSALIATKKAVWEAGLFDETILRGHDFDLWLRIAQKRFRFACNRQILAHYTISDSGLSGNAVKQTQRRLELLTTIRDRGGLSVSEQKALAQNVEESKVRLAIESGKVRLLERDFEGALLEFKHANKLRRSWKVTAVCWSLRMAPQLLWHVYRGRVVA